MEIKSNSGAAIQKIANAVMWVGILFSFVLALIIVGAIYAIGPLSFFIFFLVFGFGALISWLTAQLLKGFGELVQYTAETATYLEAIALAQQPRPSAVSAFTADTVPASHSTSTVSMHNYTADSDFQVEDQVLVKYIGSNNTVIIPNSITAIGSNAFANCSQLFFVTISENVRAVQNGAFLRCGDLTEVTLTTGTISIDLCAFADCPNLKYIFIPKSVTAISDFAFKGSPKVVIHGVPGSFAEQYAVKKNIPFVAEEG